MTRLEARYFSALKLVALLEKEFGDSKKYSVEIEGDVIEITAPRELTQVRD
ncbi:hypothetical protein GQ53DRAFT_819098 [Thozetella sp. PMI_491]|nr:hypothetical protein GQ53DRAFT_819098 [Thozetella sp. PMI_491]